MKALTTTVARILFALPFGIFGLFHFMNAQGMKGMVPLPPEIFWVYLVGVALLAACVGIIVKKIGNFNAGKIASLLLALLLLIFVITMHIPGVAGASGQQEMMGPMQNLLKDFGLMAGALAVAGLLHYEEQTENAKAS